MQQLLLANPKRRKSRRRTGVAKRRTRRYRRNPSMRGLSGIGGTFKKGAIGAGGALLTEVAISKLPLPANLSVGPIGAVVQGGVGIGVGMIVGNIMKNKSLGTQIADGAVTVALYKTGKSMVGPSIGLSAWNDGLLGNDWMDDNEVGYLNPAETLDVNDDVMNYWDDNE